MEIGLANCILQNSILRIKNRLTDDEVEEYVTSIYKYIRKNNIPMLLAKDVDHRTLNELWNNIIVQQLIDATFNDTFVVLGRDFNNYIIRPRLILPDGQVKYMIMISGDDAYWYCDRITDFYQEEHRLDAYNTSRSVNGIVDSPNNLWNNHPKILKKWIRSAVERVNQENDHQEVIDYDSNDFRRALIESIHDDRVHVSQYRVTWVVSIISYFRQFITINKMLDPSMGWGDRLLGAMKSKVNYYGYDPNEVLHPGYKRMIKDWAPEGYEYSHVQAGFEHAKLDDDFDFVLTSPPYGEIEVYSSDSNQSIVKYKKNWFTKFYDPYIRRAWNALRIGGIMIIQIGDNSKFQMVDHTIKLFERYDNCKHWGQFFTYSNIGKYPNLHLVYSKVESD